MSIETNRTSGSMKSKAGHSYQGIHKGESNEEVGCIHSAAQSNWLVLQ